MTGFVAVLWALYVSECFVRWRGGDWVFRAATDGTVVGVSEPDITFLDGRVAFVWASLLPGRPAHVASGSALDPRRCRIRLKRARGEIVWLRRFATSLFALVLILFPILVLTEWLLPALPILAAAFVLAWAGTLATFFAAYRRVYGSRPALETWLVLALSPLSLIRAPHVIVLHVVRGSHPVAAANALCGDQEFLRVCRLWLFDCPELRPAIQDLVDRRGLQRQLTDPPAATEPEVSRFCERCHATFNEKARVCADCEDVVLTPLPATAAS